MNNFRERRAVECYGIPIEGEDCCRQAIGYSRPSMNWEITENTCPAWRRRSSLLLPRAKVDRSSIVKSSDFLRETRNPDFYEKFLDFYVLAENSK